MKQVTSLNRSRRRNIIISSAIAIVAVFILGVYLVVNLVESSEGSLTLAASANSVTLKLGEDSQISYTLSNNNAVCTFEESDTSVFTASFDKTQDNSVILTPVSVGNASLTIISIYNSERVTAEVQVTVVDPDAQSSDQEEGDDSEEVSGLTDFERLTQSATAVENGNVITVKSYESLDSSEIDLSKYTFLIVSCDELSVYLIDSDGSATGLEYAETFGGSKQITLETSYSNHTILFISKDGTDEKVYITFSLV